MRTLKTVSTVLALTVAIMALPIAGKAADLNGKTVIAFTQPVAIPGMVLQAGAYVFKTSNMDQHVIQVFDGSETHLLTTLMTVPTYRNDASSKPAVFEEQIAGAPQALRAWFSSGETSGREFVYAATSEAAK